MILYKEELWGLLAYFFYYCTILEEKFNDLISNDFKETWFNYILIFTTYIFLISLTIIFFNENKIVLKNLALSFFFSIALFPLFFFIVDKLSHRFRSYNE